MAQERVRNKHHDTLRKKDLQTAIAVYNNSVFRSPNGTKRTKRQLFIKEKVPERTAYRIIKAENSRRLHNDPDRKETRGCKSKLTAADPHH